MARRAPPAARKSEVKKLDLADPELVAESWRWLIREARKTGEAWRVAEQLRHSSIPEVLRGELADFLRKFLPTPKRARRRFSPIEQAHIEGDYARSRARWQSALRARIEVGECWGCSPETIADIIGRKKTYRPRRA